MAIIKGIDIEVTAYNSEEDAWRLDRLERILTEISKKPNGIELLKDIKSIYDKKGCVMITWKTKEPDDDFKKDLNYFWQYAESELADIEHQLAD
jgi:hypothetical protein